MPQFGASLIVDSLSAIYDCNVFKIQATDHGIFTLPKGDGNNPCQSKPVTWTYVHTLKS